MALELRSRSFSPKAPMPQRLTQDGENLSPDLSWTGVPGGTASLALVVDDPDAPDPEKPERTYVHWVLYNLPPTTPGIPEGQSGLFDAANSGKNDASKLGYVGPAPPKGRHRYFFKLYALDTKFPLDQPTKATLTQAMVGHVLEQATLMGTYERGAKHRAA